MRQRCHLRGESMCFRALRGRAISSVQRYQSRGTVCNFTVSSAAGTTSRRAALLVGFLASISQEAFAEQVAVGVLGRGLVSCHATLPVTMPSSSQPAGKVTVRPDLAPDQSKYDPTDPQLRAAAQLLQDALNAATVEQEEALWTKIIKEYGSIEAPWGPDIVGRAWGNRGNARSRQGKLQEALQDYNTAIELCPWSVDPLLNRGAVLEQLGRFKEAEDDYLSIIAVAPDDPAAWNNLGNTNLGMGNYDAAAKYFGRAASMAPAFSFAAANRCVALFAAGRTNESMREMRAVLRRYPDFPDTRAALTAALWSIGKEAEAESNWQRVDDPRYRDKQWLRDDRRWPPQLVNALTAFLEIRTVA